MKKVKTKDSTKDKIFTFSFFIFLTLIVIIPNFYYQLAMDQQLEIRMLGISVFLGLLFLPIIFNKKRGILRQTDINILKNPVVLIYAVSILIVGISIFWATNQSEAICEFLKRATFFILFLYLIIFVLPKENSRLALTKAFVLLSLIISLVGIFQLLKILSESKYSIESIYLITGNFAQKNIFSEVLFIAFTFSVYGIAIFDKIWKKAAIIGALLNLLLIAFLMTRAIWVAFFVSLGFTLLLYLFYASKSQLGNKLKPILRYFVIIFGIAIIAVVVISVIDKNKTIQNHLANTTNIKEGNSFHRLNLWKKTISLAQEKPLLGVGAGNWRIEILQYDLQVTTDRGRIMPDRAHNDYLQILAENGIIGLVTLLLLFALLLYFCVRTLKKTENFQDSFFILILFFALVGYMVDSFFAFPRERIEMQIFLNIIVAFIVFEYNNKFKKDNETKLQISIKPLAVVILCVLSISSYATYKRLQSEIGIKRIYTYSKLNNHEQIIKITNEIYSSFSTISPFCDPIMQIRAASLYQTKNDLNLVLETYNKSLKDSPYHIETLKGLAVVHANNKDYSKAFEYINTALKYAPTDVQIKTLKAKIFLSSNKIDEAYKTLRTINPKDNNADYKRTVNFILVNKVTNIMSQINNKYLITRLEKIIKKPNFLHKIYSNSIEKNEDFEKTLLDTIFSNRNQKEITNDESLKQLKIKYKVK